MKLTVRRDRRSSQVRDASVLKKHVHGQLKKLWKECVRAFIKEVAQHIAIDTGMSMASMMPLAAKVQLATFLRSKISGSSNGPRYGYTDMNFSYSRNQQKSISHGERLGSRAYELTFGAPSNPQFVFEFNIVVLQHWLHDSSANYQRSHNWKSMDQGQKAFLRTWHRLLPRYVNAGAINQWLLTGVFNSAIR